MKKLFALVLALTMLVGLVACSDPAEAQPTEAKQETTAAPAGETEAAAAAGEKGVIYGIYKAGDQTWFIDEGDAAKAAAEAAGYSITYVDAKMSPEEYLKAIDNAIANKAAGIVTCVPDQTMSQTVVDECREAGIPVVAADDALEVNGEKLVP